METYEQQLARQEDTRYKPYDDATGKELKHGDILKGNLTIGVGWNLSDIPIPQSVVDLMLDISIKNADADLNKHLSWTLMLDNVRRDVFRNLCFNMGITRLMKFAHMILAAEISDFETAANELQNSNWFHQVGDRGIELVSQLRTGQRR
jgi:lysozyme